MSLMVDKQDKKPPHPETFFLPPLKMVLTFLDKESPQGEKDDAETQEKATEKEVEKLIEKLSEKEE
ncbi:MAG TPA: hypothetical protein VI524_14635 [Anaerolineales bacterium]|nr:hypothetical protein [Anaerolineales bacterium]